MRKMKLSVDDLSVETYAPDDEPVQRGTVGANQSGPLTDECASCGVYTCTGAECESDFLCTVYGVPTCEPYATCQGTTCLPPHC